MGIASQVIFWAGFSLAASVAATGHWLSLGNPMHRPQNPTVLNAIADLAGWLAIPAGIFAVWQWGWISLLLIAVSLLIIAPILNAMMRSPAHRAAPKVMLLGPAAIAAEVIAAAAAVS